MLRDLREAIVHLWASSVSVLAGWWCFLPSGHTRASQVALVVRNPPANAGDIRDVGPSLRWEDPLEEGIATHSSVLVWRIPSTEEPGGL